MTVKGLSNGNPVWQYTGTYANQDQWTTVTSGAGQAIDELQFTGTVYSYFDNIDVELASVPEPSSIALAGLGILMAVSTTFRSKIIR